MRRRERAVLVSLWLLATALNVGKPYHIDDAFYVAQARWIAAHPDRPTSGMIFWEEEAPTPFFRAGNHSPLVPAIHALALTVAGPSPLVPHLVTSVFCALAIVLAFAIARRHAPEHALTVTALLVLSPAFLAEQNVMLDVPLLAAWLAFFLALEHASAADDAVRSRPALVAAGAALALALLVKLSSLVLVVPLALHGLRRTGADRARRVALAVAMMLPAGALALWALASHAEVGEIAFVGRAVALAQPLGDRSPIESLAIGAGRVGLFVIVVGGVLPGLAVLVPSHLLQRRAHGVLVVSGLALVVLVVVGRTIVLELAAGANILALADEPLVHSVLRALDLALGGLALAFALVRVREGDDADRRLGLWLIVAAVAACALSPFLAARHALLAIVPLALLLARAGLLDHGPSRRLALVVAAVMGVVVALADHRIARVYAEAPARILRLGAARAPSATVHFVGHWGFQEHAARAGLVPYVAGQTALARGDWLVEPLGIDAQIVADDDRARLEPLEVIAIAPEGPLDRVRTLVDREGLYASWYGLPWTLRTGALERFVIHRVAR